VAATWRVVSELTAGERDARDALLASIVGDSGEEALTEAQRERLAERAPLRHALRERAGVLDGYAVLADGPILEAEPALGTFDEDLAMLLESAAAPTDLLLRNADDDVDAVLRARGWRPGRTVLHLTRGLPAPDPPHSDVTVRAFVPGRDEQAWVDANNAAFAGHPSQSAMTVERLGLRERAEWFDPAGFLFFEDHGELVASCWTKMRRTEDGVVGEIYVIFVVPGAQGRGLGRHATLEGLRSLFERGARRAELFVESTNVAGRALYAELGFEPCERVVVYRFEPPRP